MRKTKRHSVSSTPGYPTSPPPIPPKRASISGSPSEKLKPISSSSWRFGDLENSNTPSEDDYVDSADNSIKELLLHCASHASGSSSARGSVLDYDPLEDEKRREKQGIVDKYEETESPPEVRRITRRISQVKGK